jgi:hypothetical protein
LISREQTRLLTLDSQIITRLINWDLVVADLTGLNANAFYEIGIRHMAIKPIIHMFAQDQTLPFDVSHYRAVPFFLGSPTGLAAARSALSAAADAVLADGYIVENPVTQARGRAAFEAEATPPLRLVQGQIDTLEQRFETLERRLGRSTNSVPALIATGNGNAVLASPARSDAIRNSQKVVSAAGGLWPECRPLIFQDGRVMIPLSTAVTTETLEALRDLLGPFGYTVSETTFSP